MKFKFFISLIALTLMFATVATGQKRRQTPRAKPRPIQTPAPTPTPLSTLSIEVGLIYDNGDVKPVARTTFYVLDEDMSVILKSVPDLIDAERRSLLGPLLQLLIDTNDKAKYDAIIAAIKSHTVASATTDFGGKAKFSSLQPGVRFLYGEFNAGRNYAVWDMKIELKVGDNLALTLDNKNAAAAFSLK